MFPLTCSGFVRLGEGEEARRIGALTLHALARNLVKHRAREITESTSSISFRGTVMAARPGLTSCYGRGEIALKEDRVNRIHLTYTLHTRTFVLAMTAVLAALGLLMFQNDFSLHFLAGFLFVAWLVLVGANLLVMVSAFGSFVRSTLRSVKTMEQPGEQRHAPPPVP